MTQNQSINTNSISETLIAPCGMNCQLCRAYVRVKKACPGCRSSDNSKSKSCIECHIKNCEKIVSGGISYCFECDRFPCVRLVHLDRRYRTKYGMSMIENLSAVKNLGIKQFIENEIKRWACPECGGLLCVHKSECIHCQHIWR